jgi:hypothetical protein
MVLVFSFLAARMLASLCMLLLHPCSYVGYLDLLYALIRTCFVLYCEYLSGR